MSESQITSTKHVDIAARDDKKTTQHKICAAETEQSKNEL